MRNLVLIGLMSAGAANAADRPVSPSEFEAMVLGKTFAYSAGGAAYGAEEYLDDRRVRWSFLDGDCQDGEWYVSGNQICFIYEIIESPQCWQFYLRNGRLVARFGTNAEVYETSRQDEPLLCLGPKIGV